MFKPLFTILLILSSPVLASNELDDQLYGNAISNKEPVRRDITPYLIQKAGIDSSLQKQELLSHFIHIQGPAYGEKFVKDVGMLKALGIWQYATDVVYALAFLKMMQTAGAEKVAASQRWLRLIGVWDKLRPSDRTDQLRGLTEIEDVKWISDACDFYEGLLREGGGDKNRLLVRFINMSVFNHQANFVEFIYWLKHCAAHQKCQKTMPYEDDFTELSKLWQFYCSVPCWTASMVAKDSEQWNRLYSADDVIRCIRPWLSKY